MSKYRIELPIIDPILKGELNKIKEKIRTFIYIVEDSDDKSKTLEERIQFQEGKGILSADIIGQIRAGHSIERVFSNLFEESIPSDKVDELRANWAYQERMAETYLQDFVESYLVPTFLVNSEDVVVPYHYILTVEGRCKHKNKEGELTCGGHVERFSYEIEEPISEIDFYYDKSLKYIPHCNFNKKLLLHYTNPISTVHSIIPDDKDSTDIDRIQRRLKSAGRLIPKLVDYLLQERGGISDLAAARLVFKDQGDQKKTKRQLIDQTVNKLMKKFNFTHQPERIEYVNIDKDLNPIHADGEKYSTKRTNRFIEVIVPYHSINIGLQIQTKQWYNEMERTPDLKHIKYVEERIKEREEIARARIEAGLTDYAAIIKSHLEPIFK